MTDDWAGFVCSRQLGCRSVRVPRTEPPPEWEARRHANEAAYWAEHLDEFAKRLPGIRHKRGDERGARLRRDVIAAVKAAQSEDIAVLARDRLSAVWRWREEWGAVSALTMTADELDEALSHADECLCPLCEKLVLFEIELAEALGPGYLVEVAP